MPYVCKAMYMENLGKVCVRVGNAGYAAVYVTLFV